MDFFYRWLLLLGAFTCVSQKTNAQSLLPNPDEFLPHRLGQQFTPHHLLVDYFEALAKASERVDLAQYGHTNEGRPLLLAFISSPANLARLEDIRLNNLRRAGLAPGAPDPALDLAIVWLSFSVHGNEASGAEASMGVAFDLANPEHPNSSKWLENTLVIIDPVLNPDGNDRYTHWYRSVATRRPNAQPQAREQQEPWPGGRVNHYYFDLNRDWAWQTQLESQHRLKVYQQWMPHIHADLHEQGYTENYYFAPAAPPFHDFITPFQRSFQTDIGRNHARYFDRAGWLYFTRERFDLFYPSYGDTYPTFNGAIGMTYEQAGLGQGTAVALPNQDTLTLLDRLSHHRTTALSTVEIAHQQKKRLVEEFEKYFQLSSKNPPGKYKTYVVSAKTPRGQLRSLLTLLDRNGIRYGRASRSQTLDDAYHYRSCKDSTAKVAAGDLLISAYQPRAILTQVLFDPVPRLEDSVTYDITAWSIPEAFGLLAYASTQRLAIDEEAPFTLPPYPEDPLAGVSLAEVYAFILPWEDSAAHNLQLLS
ncbi:MAG: hypothetical protein HC821_02565 [Lewinella sp.]|nr:hypothetical protein [Lewinella sp.]